MVIFLINVLTSKFLFTFANQSETTVVRTLAQFSAICQI